MYDSSEFGKLSGNGLMRMYMDGFDLVAIILNTSRCHESGEHWIPFVVSHKSASIEILDSTGDYDREMAPIIAFAEKLRDECSLLFGRRYELKIYNE